MSTSERQHNVSNLRLGARGVSATASSFKLGLVAEMSECLVPEGIYFIANQDDVGEYVDVYQNPVLCDVIDTFFEQTIRPDGFHLFVGDFCGECSKLITGDLPEDFGEFRDQWYDGQDYHDVMFTIGIGPGGRSVAISSDALFQMESYAQFTSFLNLFYGNSFRVVKNQKGLEFISLPQRDIGYLDIPSPQENSATGIISGKQNSFNAFKKAAGERVKITFEHGTGEADTILDVSLNDVNSWKEFCEKCSSDRQVPYYYDSATGLVVIGFLMKGEITAIKNTEKNGPDFVKLLKLDRASGCIAFSHKITFDDNEYTHNSCEFLCGTADTGAELIPRTGEDIRENSKLFEKLKSISENHGLIPEVICLATYQSMGFNVVSEYIEGFNAYIPSEWGTILSLFTDEITDYSRFFGHENARSIIVNFSSSYSYLDVAIGAYIAGTNPKKELRSAQGLVFNGIDPEPFVSESVTEKFKRYRINYYCTAENGVQMYRHGQVLSDGAVGYIDTAMGINALIRDLQHALNRLITIGGVKVNSLGGSEIYAILAGICAEYVESGFLSAINMDDKLFPPYEIKVERSFSREQLDNGIYPRVEIHLASVIFAGKITVRLMGEGNA